MHDSVRS